jgi:hypothetical protein
LYRELVFELKLLYILIDVIDAFMFLGGRFSPELWVQRLDGDKPALRFQFKTGPASLPEW